ncbi:MAG: autotransporter outer membrane beta-barrel domain-containing protein, partial [Pseudomonadota bacterium]
TVGADFAAGAYVAKQYTILTATGGVTGTFDGLVNTNLPAGFISSLSYNGTNAFLNLNLAFALPGGGNINQQNVANALTNFFNSTGSIPLVFGGLTPAGLTQISGETATGSQQTTFDAMNQFMGVMTDPFISGRGDPASAGGGATGYADEGAMAYAGRRNPNDALAAIYTKAPPRAAPFEQRWSVWAAGYGGSQTTDGNTALGSNTATSSIYGTAVGADVRLSPATLAGFALAGGGTQFNIANGLGSGRSDLFQAGGFLRHNIGASYLLGALAYGWQDVTTNRTVTVAGIDQLRAQFNASAFSARLEGGSRFVTAGLGITPYAAVQSTTFALPSYAESAVVGANTFALAYGSKNVTDTRTELGVRSDRSFAMTNAILTLRGRLAWAYDFNPDRNIGATFQTLPGASFVVNGAQQAHNSALTTAAAEMKWMNGWSAAATFEGAFSEVTRSYAGKGVVRYAW